MLPDDLLEAFVGVVLPEGARDWSVLGERLAGAFQGLAAIEKRADSGDIVARRDFPTVVAAVIDRLGEASISNREQAFYWSISADEQHREAADNWFDAHPAERQILDAQIEALKDLRRH